jgi:hypothetical protein
MMRCLKQQFKKGGLKLVIIQVWRYVLQYSVFAETLLSLLGPRIHEKLVRCVTIGYWPRIRDPRSFNEKTIHRKLYTNKEIYATVADKWLVRDYVREQGNEDILNDVYLATTDPNEIKSEDLPEKFVVKATHGSGYNIFVEDKNDIDFDELRHKCKKFISTSYPSTAKEYWYHEIEPRIIIERYLTGDNNQVPRDFKFFVYHGDVEYVQVDFDRNTDHKRTIFDAEWNELDLTLHFPKGKNIKQPDNLDKMISIAENLGSEFDFIRVDLYDLDDHGIIFGEMTVAHGSGGERFDPVEFDFKFGSHW